ncbi:MAG: insulinase family protein [Bacteroidetes bacterium]|nr:insulinase family protein [Bacteroidota bacterium]
MQKLIIAGALLLSGIVCGQKGKPGTTGPKSTFPLPVFVEEVKKTGNETVIPYKRYKLSNGLNLVIHEDHSDPIVYVDVTYHVGSAREQQGRSGFAHFFEHMMFQGSKNVGDEQHFKVITEAGGTLNGTTNSDRTNYFETVPGNQLEKMLWLEADRMGFLLDSVTQKKFEVQRATVKNERGQRYDNAPYGLAGEKIGEALYPQGHPYSWLTIGYIEDLNRVDVNDLKRFYMRWYGPNNAVLTISGDVKTDDVLLMVQKYFGSISVGPDVKPQTVSSVKLESSRYISYEDNVKFPMMSMAFPSVKMNDKDDAALDVLSTILAGTQGSPIYKAFIESRKATSANAFQYARELAGQFQIMIRANPGTALGDMEKELQKTLAEWEKKGATDDDIQKFKAQFQSNLYNRLSTVQGKGASIASYFTFTGNANYIKKEIDRYMKVTKEDVMRVYNTYIKNKPAVVLSILPKGKGDLRTQPDNWKMYDRKVEEESAEYKNLKYTEPKDEFNRALTPKAGPASAVPVPDFYTTKINNAIPLIGVKETEIPKVNILLSFKAGHRYEPKEKSGVAELTASMLEQSSVKTKAEEIENKLDRLGSSVAAFAGDEDFNISIQSTKPNLKATLKIIEESFFEPKFDKEEFDLEKKKQLDGITQGLTNASVLAENAYRRLLYGTNNVMSLPSSGTSETVESITVEDVKNFYNSLNSSMLTIAVTGDASKEEIEKELAFLSRLKTGNPLPASVAEVPKIDKTRIYFVDKKNAAQSEIRIGYIALPYDYQGDYYKNNIMNYSFGGAFNSRINFLLRETKGWTYGTRSGFYGSKFPGPFTISGGFKANTTDSTLVEMFKELKSFTESGINDEELSFTKNAIAQSDALKYESPMQKLGFIKRVLEYDLPKDYVATQTKILNDISKEKINEYAKKYLPYNNMVIVVVGDKAANFEKVKKLGFEVTEIDSNGKQVN